MPKITHFNYLEIKEQEQKLKLLLQKDDVNNMLGPKPTTINAILNYSKALSIRKLERIGAVEIILN